MTYGVMDDIDRIQGARMPWLNTRLGHEKRKNIHLIYVLYILLCNIYCIYLICLLYILYIAYVCRIKSEWYIKRTSFTTYMVKPM